jgi:hypothetical protein
LRFGWQRWREQWNHIPDFRLETLSHIAAPLGLLFVGLQMCTSAHDQRVARSLDMIGRMSADPLAASVRRLNGFWEARSARLAVARRLGFDTPASTSDFAAEQFRLAKGEVASQELFFAAYDIAAYYDEVAICVDRGVCDEKTARSFLGRSAKGFWSLQGAIVREQAGSLGPSTLGCGIWRFLDPPARPDDADAKEKTRCADFSSR